MPDRWLDLVVEGGFQGIVGADNRGKNCYQKKNRDDNQAYDGGFIAPELTDLLKKRVTIVWIFWIGHKHS
jgi:hypothetical protein